MQMTKSLTSTKKQKIKKTRAVISQVSKSKNRQEKQQTSTIQPDSVSYPSRKNLSVVNENTPVLFLLSRKIPALDELLQAE